MNDFHLEKIGDYVARRSRLSFGGRKKAILRQRLEKRLAHLDLPDLAAYWEYLQKNVEEEVFLFDLLTTNETSFFRNPEQFAFLRENILPEIERERGLDVVKSWGRRVPVPSSSLMTLRAFCAGCSTGEEPYSLAMTIMEGLRYHKAWDINILAGDISVNCLQTAAGGFYEADRLQGIPSGLLRKYTTAVPGGVVMNTDVRDMVSFTRINLGNVMSEDNSVARLCPSGGFDLIFCRNVMIYFSRDCQQSLVDTLHRLLVPGGYLFTGDAEPLHLFDHEFEAVQEAGCLIYRKKLETTHDAEAV